MLLSVILHQLHANRKLVDVDRCMLVKRVCLVFGDYLVFLLMLLSFCIVKEECFLLSNNVELAAVFTVVSRLFDPVPQRYI